MGRLLWASVPGWLTAQTCLERVQEHFDAVDAGDEFFERSCDGGKEFVGVCIAEGVLPDIAPSHRPQAVQQPLAAHFESVCQALQKLGAGRLTLDVPADGFGVRASDFADFTETPLANGQADALMERRESHDNILTESDRL
jgi:hypothetical protein